MDIAFHPPIGQVVNIRSLSTRPTVLVFTARLSIHDYERLVKDGGRVQLWGDIQEKGQLYGVWHALDFEAIQDRTDEEHVVYLGSSPLAYAHRNLERVLFLVVRSLKRFQFTYRILYSSGDVVWLGQYGRNGSVVFKEKELDIVDGVELREGWTYSQARQSYIFEKNQAGILDTLTLKKMEDTCVLALAEEG